MGHSYTGLLFARTLDPSMESPVPAAYAYKLMLFFVPSSGAKNTIVVSLMLSHGPWAALLVCLCVVATWIIIFDTHFKHRFLLPSATSESAGLSRPSSHTSNEDDPFVLEPLMTDGSNSINNNNNSNNASKFSESDEEGDYHLSVPTPVYPSSITGAVSRKSSLAIASSLQSFEQSETAAASTVAAGLGNSGLSMSIGASIASLGAKYVPRVVASEPSSIISAEQMGKISLWLSDSKASRAWTLSYSLRQHGKFFYSFLFLSLIITVIIIITIYLINIYFIKLSYY